MGNLAAQIDHTHDPGRRSWVASANGHADFPMQNLPLGLFSPPGGAPRPGVAIGDEILDLDGAARAGWFTSEISELVTSAHGGLNGLLAAGAGPRRALRLRLFELLSDGHPVPPDARRLLHRADTCVMHLPAAIGDYTDFYAGIHHAMNAGKLFRPDNPLLPNYKHVPIGYHGRSSSIVVSGHPVRRPGGQQKGPDQSEPSFGPSRRLDFELELGVWIGAGNALGEPIAIANAPDHIGGFCLLNDWSARDIQGWEYQPLGPFLGKSFATSVSPWIITPEALAPFRVAQPARPEGDPSPLPYLVDRADQESGAFAVELEVVLQTEESRRAGRAPQRIAISNANHLYWTVAQLVTHHSSNGCNLRPGDLLGTGTISAPTSDGLGSLLEITHGGRTPLALESGQSRTFLEDGDEVCLRARARREGYASIGFGEVRGTVLPAA